MVSMQARPLTFICICCICLPRFNHCVCVSCARLWAFMTMYCVWCVYGWPLPHILQLTYTTASPPLPILMQVLNSFLHVTQVWFYKYWLLQASSSMKVFWYVTSSISMQGPDIMFSQQYTLWYPSQKEDMIFGFLLSGEFTKLGTQLSLDKNSLRCLNTTCCNCLMLSYVVIYMVCQHVCMIMYTKPSANQSRLHWWRFQLQLSISTTTLYLSCTHTFY